MNISHFLDGIRSCFEFYPVDETEYIQPSTKTDREKLAGDWRNIGNDMRKAIHKVNHEQKASDEKQ